MDDRVPHSRRRFFAESTGRLLRPIANVLERKWPVLRSRTFLRPPGAIEESEFLNTCMRCGACADACPVDAILSLRVAQAGDAAAGTPTIFPSRQACVLCDQIPCTKACPSGALQLVAAPSEVRMGLAELSQQACLRSRGEDCRLCVEECPLGVAAIGLESTGRVRVHRDGCVGCGVCESCCPTTPKAILVRPGP